MAISSAYLHLSLARSIGQGQGDEQFQCKYLANGTVFVLLNKALFFKFLSFIVITTAKA